MKKTLLLPLVLLMSLACAAASRLYSGTSTLYSDIAYTIDSQHIYRGTSTLYSDIVYTYDSRHIYRGTSTLYSDIVYTFQ